MRLILIFMLMSFSLVTIAQKKPLDHTVYDSWQNIGEKKISNNGRWMVYSIDLQEGDGQLVIQQTSDSRKIVVPRGYNVSITSDNKYAIFLIRPFFKETREAKIKKKKQDEFPKDSL